jgi:formylglycine-generating enzyme required for sulfatase activity
MQLPLSTQVVAAIETAEPIAAEPIATEPPAPTEPAAATEPPAAMAIPANWRVAVLPGGVESGQVLVPAGAFMMGADDEDSDTDEDPIHEVRLDAFWLDVTEVTNAQYAAFVADTGFITADELDGEGYTVLTDTFENVRGANWRHPRGPESDIVGQDDLPVTMVSYDDARAYCAWAGGRLPTEAQWEYAARGPDAPLYPWGDVFSDQRVNACDRNCPMSWADDSFNDGYTFAAAVATFGGGVSWVGAEDMAGNVWEWTADWWDETYYARSPVDNPTGPSGSVDEDGKSVRGGAWSSTDQGVRSTTRVSVGAWRGHFDVGFRCVYDVGRLQ